MLEENGKPRMVWDPNSHYLLIKNSLKKTLIFGVLSLLLLSTTVILARSVANLPNVPPNTEPAGEPIPGQFIVIFRIPTTIPNALAAQQAMRSLEQRADTL